MLLSSLPVDAMCVLRLAVWQAKMEQTNAVPGVSLAAPSFFHNNAQVHTPVRQSRKQRGSARQC